MRKTIIAGNWKMNMTPSEARKLIEELVPLVKNYNKCEIVVCPPAIDIPTAAEAIKGSNIKLGAQNVHWEEKGAFTGEISVSMLKELGAEYAIIGHSERRAYFGETDEGVNKRARFALQNGITPIICVGETLEQRKAGETNEFVSKQIQAALKGMTSQEVMHLHASAPAPPVAQKYTAPLRSIASHTSRERSPLPIIAHSPMSRSAGEYTSILPEVVGPHEPMTIPSFAAVGPA